MLLGPRARMRPFGEMGYTTGSRRIVLYLNDNCAQTHEKATISRYIQASPNQEEVREREEHIVKFKRFATLPVAVACAALTMGASLPVQAQSSVQMSGLVDVFGGSMQYVGDKAHKVGMGNNGMSTSWWGLSGDEDLGNGVKVGFKLGSFLRPTDGAQGRFNGNETFWSRDARVGVSGNFGSLWLGRNVAPNFLPTILFNPFGDSFAFSPLVLHANVPPVGLASAIGPAAFDLPTSAADTGWSNQVAYTTPSFGGLTTTLHYQFAGAGSSNGKRNVAVSALYFNGPIGLTGFWEQARSSNPQVAALPNQRSNWMLGGSYDFKVTKLYATYGQSRTKTEFKNRTFSLGASAPVGPGSVLAGYANTRYKAVGGGGHATRQTLTVGYDYNLSKRTDIYTNVMYDHMDKVPSKIDGGVSFAAGIRHRF